MKRLSILTIMFLSSEFSFCQDKITKNLFFHEDIKEGISFYPCGDYSITEVFDFVNDTLKTGMIIDTFYLAIECPGTYGINFFKRNRLYTITLSKDFRNVRPSSFLSAAIDKYGKSKNFYLAENIKTCR